MITNAVLNDQLERFWKINEEESATQTSALEIQCEEIFRNTYKRTSDGRFQVVLLLKADPAELGESLTSAKRSLLSMERRFEKDPVVKERYHAFLDEYLTLGHMSRVPENELHRTKCTWNYLPHHAVCKESSTTTKLRVVFDASRKTGSGLSLNDCVMAGPIVQHELFDIILRFRQHRFVLTGDIIKMYRQVWLNPDQRNLQCILWRKTPDHLMETFRLNTVTFGVASSPYLATRCLKQLAQETKETHPSASRVIEEDFYVDDLLTGGETEEEIFKIKTEVTSILQAAGFELQKSYSNIEHLDQKNGEHEITEIKTLGLRWNPGTDQLNYHTACEINSSILTKRALLSVIAQIFDPLGLIGPLTVRSMILLQLLWKLKIGWDSSIPTDLSLKWDHYTKQIQGINKLVIPRHVVGCDPVSIQLHGFSDASEAAYGACLYVRSVGSNGEVQSRLLCARSRVAPIKMVSLARLELCGALLLANLYAKVKKAISIRMEDAHFWSDSTIALAWIRGDAARWHTFVGNRVAEIQRSTPAEKWKHVVSEQNPADLISRGMDAEDLQLSELWWNGPSWLSKNECEWPQNDVIMDEVPESKKVTLNFVVTEMDFSIFTRFSSWSRLLRVTAYCCRFKENLQRKMKGEKIIVDPLTSDELNKARKSLIMLHQQEAFRTECLDLQRNKPVNVKSRLAPLNPFRDEEGLIRVGGLLNHAPLSYSQRFPIVLAPNHVLTKLIIQDFHYRNLHAGISLLSATLRETYWILSSRSVIRYVLRKCVLCFRLKPISPTQLMGELPRERVTPSRVFAHTGIDYAGPFTVKIARNRTCKAYLCVFVCMATKAVHLELVLDLTIDRRSIVCGVWQQVQNSRFRGN